jgi:hypothetical protein
MDEMSFSVLAIMCDSCLAMLRSRLSSDSHSVLYNQSRNQSKYSLNVFYYFLDGLSIHGDDFPRSGHGRDFPPQNEAASCRSPRRSFGFRTIFSGSFVYHCAKDFDATD